MVLEASAETLESHGFKSNHWYVVEGIEGRDGIHIQNCVIKEERGQHYDIVLTDFEDELKVLENLLSNQDSIRK
jgi:hypothetical protein